MSNGRILVLSNTLELPALEDEYKVVLEKLIDPLSRPTSDYDKPSVFTLNHLAQAADKYAAIIICNNRGAGIFRAERIPQEMKEKTVIIWTSNPSEDMKLAYRNLGFHHFSIVWDVENYLRDHLLKP